MTEYHRLLRKVLDHGSYREDRTGTGAYSVFGEQSRYDPHPAIKAPIAI